MVNHRGVSDSRSISKRPIRRKKNRQPSSPDRRHATKSNNHGVDAAAAAAAAAAPLLTTCAPPKNVHSFRSLYQNCRKTSETTERKRQRRESTRHHEAEHSHEINSSQEHRHQHPPATSSTTKCTVLSCNMNSGAVLFFDNITPQASEQDFLEHLTRNKNSLGNEGKRNGDFHVVNIDYELSESGSKNRAFVELSTRAEARRAEKQIDTLFQGRHFDMELNSRPTRSPRGVSSPSVRPFSPSASPRNRDRDSYNNSSNNNNNNNNNNPSRGVVAAPAASAANEKALHALSLTAPKHRHARWGTNHPPIHRASAPSPNHMNDVNNPERQQEVRRGYYLVPPTNANKKCRSTAPAAEHGRDSNSQRRPRASDEHRDNSTNLVVHRKDTISERSTSASDDPTDDVDHDGGSNESKFIELSRPSSQRNQSRKRNSDTRNQSAINVGYHQSPRRRCNSNSNSSSNSSNSSSQDVKVELEDSQLQQGTSPFQPYCGNSEIPVGTSNSNSNNDSINTKRDSSSSRSNQNQNNVEGDSIRPDAIMSDSVCNSNREKKKDNENRVAQNHEQNPTTRDRDPEDEAYEALRSKYDASIAEVEQWKRRHEEVTRSSESRVIEMECLFEQAKAKQTELRKLESAYEDKTNTLGDQIQKLQFECERAKAETEDWKKQYDKLRSDAEEKFITSSKEIEKTRKACAEAVRKTREMVDAKNRFSKGIEDEHKKSLKLFQEAHELQKKIQELTAQYTAKSTLQQDNILQLEKELQNEILKHQGEMTAATKQKRVYQIRIGQLEELLEKSNVDNNDRNALHQKLRDEIRRKHKEELEKAKSTAAAAARYQSDLKWEERLAKEAKDLDAANQKWKEEILGKHNEEVEKAKLAAAAAARKDADLRWEDRFSNKTRDLEAANQKWKEGILQAHREELQETKTAAAHAARTESDLKWEDRLANEARDRDEADQKRREEVLQAQKEELKNAQSKAAAAAADEIETLKNSLKQFQQQVQILEEQAREQSKAEQNLRDEMLRKHELELEEARSLSLSSSSAADVSSRATPKRRAIAIGLQQQLDQKTKECVKLQENFNKIAMQNSKHSDTIEELREEIVELKIRFQRSSGGPRMPLKIED
mmetsp:Transcript_7382/g.21464  ORF Transcript_7382/g.21464 Transcript_7382/m.21464 type:complete len:1114 (+) Transcript_7382:189-3530(+)